MAEDNPEDILFEGSGKSRYNMGIDYLRTINISLYLCGEHTRANDFAAWYNELKILYRILSPKMDRQKTKKETVSEFDRYTLLLKELTTEYQNFVKRFNNLMYAKGFIPQQSSSIQFALPRDFPEKLHNFELELRKLIDIKGMLMPDSEDVNLVV